MRLAATAVEVGMPAHTHSAMVVDAGCICWSLDIAVFATNILFCPGTFFFSLSSYSKCRFCGFDLPNLGQVPSLYVQGEWESQCLVLWLLFFFN